MQTLMERYDVWTIACGDEVKLDVVIGAIVVSIQYWEKQ
jgi:hypothetical protein